MVLSVPDNILACVRVQLLRPRVLSVRVGGAVCGLLEVADPLDGLCLEVLTAREPFEVEWLLSSLFTPTPQEMEACEAALPLAGLTDAVVEALVTALAAENLFCPVSYGHREQAVPVMAVVIDRYVRLLHLNAAVHPLVCALLETGIGGADRLVLSSLARRPVWHPESRARLLCRALRVMAERGTFQLDKVRFLTDFVGSYRPQDEAGLLQALLGLVDAYHQDGEHPIFNQQLEHHQGENIRSQYCGPDVKSFRLTMAHALLADFGYSPALP
ncbi:MAG: hypothetical protein HQL87_03340 [Magnetococcales bacterium]|nr:hypothetical protein [Magnetococcales bacterium]